MKKLMPSFTEVAEVPMDGGRDLMREPELMADALAQEEMGSLEKKVKAELETESKRCEEADAIFEGKIDLVMQRVAKLEIDDRAQADVVATWNHSDSVRHHVGDGRVSLGGRIVLYTQNKKLVAAPD